MNNDKTRLQAANAVRSSRRRALWVAKTGILAGIAALLMILEFPLPLMPVFLKYDFSEVPILLATFSMGPLTGIVVQLIKNLIHLPFSATGLIGELANFCFGSAFVGVAGLVYRYRKTRLGAVQGLVAGTLALTLTGALINYFVMVPFYGRAMGFSMEAIVGAVTSAGNTLVHDKLSLILYVFVPFNLFKGISISLIVLLIYKKLSPLLHKN